MSCYLDYSVGDVRSDWAVHNFVEYDYKEKNNEFLQIY